MLACAPSHTTFWYAFETVECLHLLQEIIEFACCALDARTLQVTQQFQRYCRPTENPVLTAFCTELTGITQSM